ncbi:hypothetical protein BH24ACT4_BH24ACT4_11490 [soil metagenome]
MTATDRSTAASASDHALDDAPDDAPDDVVRTTRADRGRSDRLFPVRAGRLGVEGLLAAAIAWAWAAISYRVWDLSFRVPINSEDDARLITNLVKNTAEQGWWTSNPDLGFPVGQQLYDFPHNGETWQLAIIRIMSLFTKSPGLLMNAYFLLGIGLAAMAAFVALRHLRFGVGTSLIASTALTWLPFRIGHGEYHLFRVSFWWVPLAVVTVLWVLHWRERFLVDPEPPRRGGWRADIAWNLRHNLRRKRLLVFAVMVVVLGGSETMTTAFTLTLLAITGLIAALRRRDPATLVVHGLAVVALGLVVAVLFLPTLRFMAANGTNAEAGSRVVTEQEQFGLKISSLLLPDASHRWSVLGEPDAKIRETTPVPSEAGMTIGLLGAAGFVGAVGHSITHGWGRRRREIRPPHDRDALRDDLGLLVVVATLIAIVSGGAILLSLAGFSQVRVWNRMSLLIGFASLAYALTWLEKGWRLVRSRIAEGPGRDRAWVRQVVGTALVIPLVGFVLWDGAHVAGLDYDAKDAAWAADEAWVQRIDEATPDGTAIFQFPVVRFPEEPPPGRMVDYDHLRGFIHTPKGHLRWSYGAIKGRPDGDWQLIVRDQLGEAGSLPALIGAGFTGVWVDTFGYEDDGARVRAELGAATGVEPLASDEGRTLYYDLRPLRDELEADGTSMADLRQLARDQLRLDLPDEG